MVADPKPLLPPFTGCGNPGAVPEGQPARSWQCDKQMWRKSHRLTQTREFSPDHAPGLLPASDWPHSRHFRATLAVTELKRWTYCSRWRESFASSGVRKARVQDRSGVNVATRSLERAGCGSQGQEQEEGARYDDHSTASCARRLSPQVLLAAAATLARTGIGAAAVLGLGWRQHGRRQRPRGGALQPAVSAKARSSSASATGASIIVTKPGQAISYPIAIPREESRWAGVTSGHQQA